MKLAVLKYDNCGNIGDEIQTLAAEQFLPRVDVRLDRDTLASAEVPEKTLLLMNGWFAQYPAQSFPPPKNIEPVFISFHITNKPADWEHFLGEKSLGYFRQHQPIGCRDRTTTERLREKGIEAYYTKCLTLTFPKRQAKPKDGKVFIVDVDERSIFIPRSIRNKAYRLSHVLCRLYGDELKRNIARQTLDLYREHAECVITSRLHCALPCAAMGIPVVFLGNPQEGRISLLEDVGIKIHPYRKFRNPVKKYLYRLYFRLFRAKHIDWSPQAVDIEAEKAKIRAMVKELLEKHAIDEATPAAENRFNMQQS